MKQLSYLESAPIMLKSTLADEHNVRLFVKEEYRNHVHVSGNKWWKLKYNLEHAQSLESNTLLTFGGPYSNNIFATAAAAAELGMKSIGMIRGEEVTNDTLRFASAKGMRLHFISREEYKNKSDEEFLRKLRSQFGNFYLLPEGGTNPQAIRGCREWGQRLNETTTFDYLCLSVGTGGTMAGLVQAMPESKTVIGFSALKGGEFLHDEINRWLAGATPAKWRIETDFHFGGYGKTSASLDRFRKECFDQFGLPLDYVYTGKSFFGTLELIKGGYFERGSTVLFLHTGGLQSLNIRLT